MALLDFVLLGLALICFGIAAANRDAVRLNLVALGLALWVAVPFLDALRAL